MRRGTTPTIIIDTEVDLTLYDAVWLTIEDNKGTEITIEDESLTITADSITATLTQEQTLALTAGALYIQIRALSPDGIAIASDIMFCTLDSILKDGVIE